MDNLVIYKNDMNTVPLRNFKSVEMDLFFSICSEMRDKGTNEIIFNFDDLKHLSNYKPTAIKRFSDDLENIYKKMTKLTFRKYENGIRELFVLFTGYVINENECTISITTNPKLQFLINDITNNFTKFELEEFIELKSSYSKTCYRLLKQFRKTGYVVFEIDNFIELFCIPSGYKMCNIDQKVLKSINNELPKYFKNLEINKISKGKGRKITHIEFVFDSQNDLNDYGSSTFRDKDGFYYSKDIMNFTDEEVSKEFLNSPEPMSERYDKEKLKQKEEMKKKWLELFPEDKKIFEHQYRLTIL